MKRSIPILLGFVCSVGSCSCADSGALGSQPSATLSNSFRAQQDLRELETRWENSNDRERNQLEPRIRELLRLHAEDPRAVNLRHYLAWLMLQRGELKASQDMLRRDSALPSGTAHDFSQVLHAGIALRSGKAAQALSQLRNLHGTLIVPDHRVICDRLLVEAALAQKRMDIATHFMLDLMLNAPAVQQQSVRELVSHWLQSVSGEQLEDAYVALGRNEAPLSTDKREHARAVTFLMTLTRKRLLTAALEQQDAELARRIMEHYVPDGDTERLAELAATGDLPPRIVGRSLGLILELSTAQRSDRSAQVAAGIAAALGLVTSSSQDEQITLRTRPASGDDASLSMAFEQLAADGAALVIAGVDEDSARAASHLAERTGVPTLLLSAPATGGSRRKRSFVLGESRQRVTQLLEQWVTANAPVPRATVAADDPLCDAQASSIGDYTFPVLQWKKDKVRSLLLLGPEYCTRSVAAELRRAGLSPLLVLGLDSAHLLYRLAPAVTFSAGEFPEKIPTKPAAGPPAASNPWYHALGHDAALLAAVATRDLDAVMTNQPSEVAQIHARVSRALQAARVDQLLTSKQTGFDGDLVLPRTLGTTTAPKR